MYTMSDCETDILEMPVSLPSIEPYMYDPIKLSSSETETHVEGDPRSSDSDSGPEDGCSVPNDQRTDNLTWCDCENCALMPTYPECLCCHEIGRISELLEETDLTCITEHEGFIGNCTNRYVIETSIYEFIEGYGPTDDNDPPEELYRFIAYRRFTRWIWHKLGKGNRKPIPSCAVKKIRETFPSQEYCGFHYTKFD